ncbi:MAG: dTDP-glucose 4,6-dehydratase [Fidelibacterota bacterium]
MKYFVTGGAGFIGSNFVLRQITKFKNSVMTFDKLTYAGNKENLHSLKDNINHQFVVGDICNSEQVQKAIDKFQPDGIIHFAAESHVDRSIDGPMEFIHTNVVGTTILLEAATTYFNRLSDQRKKEFRFLHVSTDEVYGSLGEIGSFKETTPYDPSSPYSASKASSDHLVRAWHRTFGLPVLVTNCSNNYGPFQFPEKLIPLMIINCIEEKPLPVYGKGENIRDWLFVTDHCDAIYTVIKSGKVGSTYNIGGNTEKTNLEIVNTICGIMDELQPPKTVKSRVELITYVKDRPGHDFRYAMDISKIYRELHWSPSESFSSGIRKTVEWYLENEEWWRTIQQKKYQLQRLGVK